MNITFKDSVMVIVAVALASIIAWTADKSLPLSKQAFGATAAGITNLTGLSIDTTDSGPGTLTVANATTLGGALVYAMTGTAATASNTGLTEFPMVGTCTTATSTVFDITNPFSATSTADIYFPTIVGQATSTAISVGTTTKSSGLASTDVSASLVNAAVVATTSQASIQSGQTGAMGSGQVSAGSNTVARIVVGPSEKLAGYATSTYGGVGALNYSAALTSCVYKIVWRN